MITVAIIGAGPLGRWLALASARAGFRVFLEDVMPSNLHHAQEYLRQQFTPEHARTANETASASFIEVSFVSTVEDAVREADLVIDCVPDELESKLEILWLLDRMAPPKSVITTPTTNLSILDLAGCTYRPEKCIAIAADPRALSNESPGSQIPLKTTPRTSSEAAALAELFWNRLGFSPTIELVTV